MGGLASAASHDCRRAPFPGRPNSALKAVGTERAGCRCQRDSAGIVSVSSPRVSQAKT